MEVRNLLDENFVDSYPRNLSRTKFKSNTVYNTVGHSKIKQDKNHLTDSVAVVVALRNVWNVNTGTKLKVIVN